MGISDAIFELKMSEDSVEFIGLFINDVILICLLKY